MNPYLPGMESEARSRALSMWYTPPETARRIVEFCGSVQGFRVLEPSAGRGALARPLRRAGAIVKCLDIDGGNVNVLFEDGFSVLEGDFLTFKPFEAPYDLVVMNPPFEDNGVMRHMLQALKFAPVVVCHCPLTTLAGQERGQGLWSQAELLKLAICSTRPNYGSGCGATDMCTVKVARGPVSTLIPADITIEWWP